MSATVNANRSTTAAAVTTTNIHPNSLLTPEEIEYFRDINFHGLLLRKKLHLILDLDHTLVHSKSMKSLTMEERKIINSIDDAHKLLDIGFAVKLRPGAIDFLRRVSDFFDLSVYSMGTRNYVEQIVQLLESEVGFSLFDSASVFSREDSKNMKKGLDLMMEQEKGILIVDDTESVWEDSGKENLVKIDRYEFWGKQRRQGEEVDYELARVLSILEGIHALFYEEYDDEDYDYRYDAAAFANKDVRQLLAMVKLRLAYNRELGFIDSDQHTDVEGTDDDEDDDDDDDDDEKFDDDDDDDAHWNEVGEVLSSRKRSSSWLNQSCAPTLKRCKLTSLQSPLVV